MSQQFYKTESGGFGSRPEGRPIPDGATLVTEKVWRQQYDQAQAVAQDSFEESQATVEAAAQVKARAIYDEIAEIHPLTALHLAQQIYPGFEA